MGVADVGLSIRFVGLTVFAIAALFLPNAVNAADASFEALPGLVTPAGISADGSTVIGNALVAGTGRAFRWTSADGLQVFGGSNSFAYGVSGDGSTIVGQAGSSAFSWTSAGGMQILPIGQASAEDISADGTTIVGRVGGNNPRAFRLTNADGLQLLGPTIG